MTKDQRRALALQRSLFVEACGDPLDFRLSTEYQRQAAQALLRVCDAIGWVEPRPGAGRRLKGLT